MRIKNFRLTALAGLLAVLVGGAAVSLPQTAEAQTKKKPARTGTAMRYFRVTNVADCNVYMNYSYRDNPKFQVRVANPSALTPVELAFVDKFNGQFAAVMRKRPDACDLTRPDVAGQSYQAVLSACLNQEKVMGYAESGWQGGRLPAPSNCISYRDSFAGVVNLLPKTLPAPSMTIEAWMTKAATGR